MVVYGHYRILLKTEINKTSQYEPNAIACYIIKIYIKNTIDLIHFINSLDTGLNLYNMLFLSKNKTSTEFWKNKNAV